MLTAHGLLLSSNLLCAAQSYSTYIRLQLIFSHSINCPFQDKIQTLSFLMIQKWH